MSDTSESGPPLSDPLPGTDPANLIEALRARGAERFDPVGLRFIEALARRTTNYRDGAREVLERRLARALADYRERFEHAVDEGRDAVTQGTALFPDSADALRQRFEAGDFGGLQRQLDRLNAQEGSRPLAELLARIADPGRQSPEKPIDGSAAGATLEPQGELKALQYFRGTWSKLSVDRQLSRAQAEAPENAGPLNSHHLVLQTLTQLREISPQYIEQFMLYVDGLLWLERSDSGRSSAEKEAGRADRDKKGKTRRRKTG